MLNLLETVSLERMLTRGDNLFIEEFLGNLFMYLLFLVAVAGVLFGIVGVGWGLMWFVEFLGDHLPSWQVPFVLYGGLLFVVCLIAALAETVDNR